MARVLIVEDTDGVRAMMVRALSGAGFEVIAAADGHQAQVALKEHSFVCAVVDYEVPGAKGTDILADLRRDQPNCVRILASGALDVTVTVNAVNRGEVMRVLPKPYDGNALVQAVRDALNAHDERGKRFESTKDQEEFTALKECLEQDLLSLAVQPILDAKTLKVAAYEALLRSRHAVLNGPLPVLEAAERHHRVHALGDVVCKHSIGWLHKIAAPVRLFVNLHPHELENPEAFRKRFGGLGEDAKRIVFEITERANLHDVPRSQESLAELRALGGSIAVDDVGAGSSTLALLAEIQPEFIKIDMSLVRGVHENDRKRRLVELICRFGDATNATVVAEGVETEAESATLIAAGAHLLQGYLFGKPAFTLI